MVAPPRQTQQQLNQDGSGLAAANESTMKRSLTAAKSLSNLSKLVGPRVWSERERASKVGAVPVCILGLGPPNLPGLTPAEQTNTEDKCHWLHGQWYNNEFECQAISTDLRKRGCPFELVSG